MRYLQRFTFALTFLTRIPFPGKVEYDDSLPSQSMGVYPLIGFIIGIILFLFDKYILIIFPSSIRSILLLCLLVYLTGGLHLDGFIDTVDGLFSCRKKERVLEIMHDSLVGSFGVIAVVLLFILKFTLFKELANEFRGFTLMLMPVISRWMVVFAAFKYPLATSSKMGKGFNYKLGLKQILEASFYLILIILCGYFVFDFSFVLSLLIFIVSLLVVHFITRKVIKQIGGLTGDIYGAINEIIEVVVLLTVILFQ